MEAFYVEALGMTPGPRPPFAFNGTWLYCGGQATVHLVEVPVKPAPAQPTPAGELRLEHFAFAAAGLAEFLARLKQRGTPYRSRSAEPRVGQEGVRSCRHRGWTD